MLNKLFAGLAVATFYGVATVDIRADEPVAGDAANGRKLARMCATCHGRDGVARIPPAPNIGGEDSAYLARQLDAFRTGARVNEMMTVVSKSLSDQQIADLSTWYAGLAPIATPPAGRGEEGPDLCMACHAANGISTVEDAPNLAGESDIYLITQLKNFRSGKRESEIMNEIAADLTDTEIREAAEWYSAIDFKTRKPE